MKRAAAHGLNSGIAVPLISRGRVLGTLDEIIGDSPALKRVLKQVETVAPTDSTVLIHGETGADKELTARAIHNLSRRRERTFVKKPAARCTTWWPRWRSN